MILPRWLLPWMAWLPKMHGAIFGREDTPLCHPERNEVESKDLFLTAIAQDLCFSL